MIMKDLLTFAAIFREGVMTSGTLIAGATIDTVLAFALAGLDITIVPYRAFWVTLTSRNYEYNLRRFFVLIAYNVEFVNFFWLIHWLII